jgi:enoyl-CoA hydratase/carnithine racemase
MKETIIVEQRDSLIDITLNRAEVGNLINNEMGARLIEVLAGIGPDIKLVRVTAAGDFCRGRESPTFDRSKAKASEFRELIADPALRLYNAFRDSRAPTLGVITGQASGVGCALAALCDLSIASDDALFRVPEMDHGIPPTLVMSAFLGRVPYSAIAFLVLSREQISAAQAKAWGIVSKVVAPEKLSAEVLDLTGRLLECPAASIQAVKEYLRSAGHMDTAGATALAANLIATVLSSR